MVVGEIDTLVSEIKDLIRFYPRKALQRAWWAMSMAYVKIEAENEIGQEEAISMRMIDYAQSVVASVPPAENQKDDVTDEDWGSLNLHLSSCSRRSTLTIRFAVQQRIAPTIQT